METQQHPARKRIDTGSIAFRSWLAFILFGAFIIGFLWITQVVFLQVYVNHTKEQEFATMATQLAHEYHYNTAGYTKVFDRVANERGIAIDVLHLEGNTATVQYSSSGYLFGEQAHPFPLDHGTAEVAVEATTQDGAYRKDNDAKQLIYGLYLDDDNTLLVLSMSTQLMESTTRILRVQMIIVTIVIIILSFCISFLLSSAFSQSLRQLSDSAKRLSADDYTVHFDEKGFSEAKELARTLNYATAEIRKTEALRRELISNVSHDLRTPLTIIKGYAEMIRDISGGDEQKRNEQLDIIIKEADRLSALVNDILNLSRIQNQDTPLVTAPFDLSATVERVLQSFDLLSIRDGYQIHADILPHCMVVGNEQQLELVVYNLVGNAINYTGEDKEVFVTLAAEDGKVRLSVRDTGAGMNEEQLQHIWQRYYRASEHKRSIVGTGLGLSIVQTVLQRHGAEFGVNSTPGEGSLFWFILPCLVETE